MQLQIKWCCFFLLLTATTNAQETTDTTRKELDEIVIRSFEQNQKLSSASAVVKVLTFNAADRSNKTSLVQAFNTIAGVRMEERSPGSYRINIRGSSLRSPFGVRNVKVYWNNIPVTDAGGNTYFNQFALNNFSSIEITKGPAGSLYGAGTGGLILINNFDRWQPGATIDYTTGSFGLHNVLTSLRFGSAKQQNQVTYAFQKSDGYRQQSAMNRNNVSWQSDLKVSAKQHINASVLYTDLYYQTPGALTAAEYKANPRQARPAAGSFPGAVAAKAAIQQKNFLVGITNRYQFSTTISNSTTLFGVWNQVQNAAIRNYERRTEPGFGGRTLFTFQKKATEEHSFRWIAGAELQKGNFNTQVFQNKNGNPDTLQTNDDIRNTSWFVFTQADWMWQQRWFVAAGISANKTNVSIQRLNRYPVVLQERTYRNEWAPRLALKRKLTKELHVTATVSRGFSPPTVAELLPSTGIISTELEAEYGWNKELTVTYNRNRQYHYLQLEATVFNFRLNRALVQRRDASGADFFTNAGDVRQTGIESTINYWFTPAGRKIDAVHLRADHTWHRFRYGNFVQGTNNFTGKTVPSVPPHTFSLLADVQLKNGWHSNISWYYSSSLFLNDANSAEAAPFHLLGWRIGKKQSFGDRYKLHLFAGVDNLLNETYSLGNDINAAAGRFYNAAPERNYYAGISIELTGKPKAE
jgi:iron complex outermembrane recepter protein